MNASFAGSLTRFRRPSWSRTRNGVSLHANQATLDYTDLTIEDVLNPNFRERIFHPDDIESLRDERKAALARALPFEIEQRARRNDGQYRWFLIRYNPFCDEHGRLIRWYATGTDIDDRVKAEERTRNENLALREQIDRDSMFEDIVGSSEALAKVLRKIAKIAPSDSTVLILGGNRHGEGVNCTRHSQAIESRPESIYWCKLRRNPAVVNCFRTLWSRERCLHRCGTTAPRAF